jgi:hypothetical protein
MRVFKMNDCDWVCAENEEMATEFYESVSGEEINISEIEECNIDSDCMWFNFWSPEELREFLKNNKERAFMMKYDRHGEGDFVVFLKFRDVIKIIESEYPFIICSTEF